MSENPERKDARNSVVEVQIHDNRVRLEGSEDFVSKELPDVLSLVEEAVAVKNNGGNTKASPEEVETDDDNQSKLPVTVDSLAEGQDSSPDERGQEAYDDEVEPITEVARELNVDSDALARHFYIDEDGVGIWDPMNIEPKYALLGYCQIREKLTGEKVHDNHATKTKLIDDEKVDITRWGGSFLYNLRQEGLIKDDPHSDRTRNKPFKITPKGYRELVEWLKE